MIQLFEEDYGLVKRAINIGTDVTYPASPTAGYYDGNLYINSNTFDVWETDGNVWTKRGNIKGLSISNLVKSSTAGKVDHYDVLLSDGTTTPNGIDVTNGTDGQSIRNIVLASTVGNVKNYDVILSDGSKTPNGIAVTDGVSNYVHIRYSANFDGSGMVTIPTDQTVYIGIVVTTQTSAPTDPAVYSWVRFIGKSGTGSGDMLKSDYSTLYDKVVDKAAALFDGTKEISASQLMAKDDYAEAELPGVVKKAAGLVDKKNNKEADTEILANFSEDKNGLKYKGKKVGGTVKVDGKTIDKNANDELTLDSSVIEKLSEQILGVIDGDTITFTDSKYIGGTDDYLLTPYVSDTDRFLKSQSISGNTLTVVCDDVIASGSAAVCLVIKKGV